MTSARRKIKQDMGREWIVYVVCHIKQDPSGITFLISGVKKRDIQTSSWKYCRHREQMPWRRPRLNQKKAVGNVVKRARAKTADQGRGDSTWMKTVDPDGVCLKSGYSVRIGILDEDSVVGPYLVLHYSEVGKVRKDQKRRLKTNILWKRSRKKRMTSSMLSRETRRM